MEAARDGLLVVGGSYAGMQVAASARAGGYAEPIRILSDESQPPYNRPPLSKGFLVGKIDLGALPLRGDAFYPDNAIELELGTRAASIDRASRRVTTEDGRHIGYERLVLAVGSRPRPLPWEGSDLAGVVALRTLADALQLRELLGEVATAVVVGGGFIGLEVASALTALGKQVTVIEAQSRLLARAATPPLAEYVAGVHRRRGVTLALDATVRRLIGDGQGRVRAVETGDGRRLAADLVIAGIGVVPNVELARQAGLACDDGILVDDHGRTADPSIFAAGECTRHPNDHAVGGSARLESVQHALDQAKAVGATLAGQPTRYGAVPWFWSDQHDFKLQIAGLAQDAERHVVRGDPASGRFSVFHFRSNALISVDSINRPAEHLLARKLLGARAAVTPEEAGDTGFNLASHLATG